MYPVLILLLQAQPAAPPPEPSLPVSLERIRRGLESSPGTVTVTSSAPGLPPVFRMEVHEQSLEYEHLWQNGSLTPAYVRPTRNLYQHEFLGTVTPDLFRATAVHPCCDVLPAIEYVGRTLRQGLRKYSESRARREVRKAIEEHARAHRPAEKP